jgi:1-acyl-sn-glycerol-3-phosphate acyltransferase
MKQIGRIIISLNFWFELFFLSAIFFCFSVVLWMATILFDKRLFILHKYTCFWSNVVLLANPMWRISITGRENIDPKQTYVMVSNHQSGADILVIFSLYAHFKWVSKKSLFLFPFIGWNMALNKYIPLDRASGGSMSRMMEEARRNLRQHNSLMIFPEGTRSKTGKLQPFKNGAFQLALETKTPVLPIAITGTSRAIQKGGFLINRNFDIKATVLEPIAVEDFEGMNSRELASWVHELIESEL